MNFILVKPPYFTLIFRWSSHIHLFFQYVLFIKISTPIKHNDFNITRPSLKAYIYSVSTPIHFTFSRPSPCGSLYYHSSISIYFSQLVSSFTYWGWYSNITFVSRTCVPISAHFVPLILKHKSVYNDYLKSPNFLYCQILPLYLKLYGPCIVIYLCNKNQPDSPSFLIYFNNILHMFRIY